MREKDSSYLLRIWKDGKGDEAWRASLQQLGSKETHYFLHVPDLLEHLSVDEDDKEFGEA